MTTNPRAQHAWCELNNNHYFIIVVSSLRPLWDWRTDRQKSSMGCLGTCWALCPFRQALSLKWAPVIRPSSSTSSRRSRWGSRRCSLLVRPDVKQYITLHYTTYWYTLNYSIEKNLILVLIFFFLSRSRLHVIPPSVPSGHEGSPLQQSA